MAKRENAVVHYIHWDSGRLEYFDSYEAMTRKADSIPAVLSKSGNMVVPFTMYSRYRPMEDEAWKARYGTKGLRLLVHHYMVETDTWRKPKLERMIRDMLDELSAALEAMD